MSGRFFKSPLRRLLYQAIRPLGCAGASKSDAFKRFCFCSFAALNHMKLLDPNIFSFQMNYRPQTGHWQVGITIVAES